MADNAIIQVLQKARMLGASDVHIAANEPAGIRLHGRITRPWPEQKIFGDQIRGFVSDTLDEETRTLFRRDKQARHAEVSRRALQALDGYIAKCTAEACV